MAYPEVFGKTLYSYARQKCLEEGAFQKDQEAICIKQATENEVERVRKDKAVMVQQLKTIKKIYEKGKDKPEENINLDLLQDNLDEMLRIAERHKTTYNDSQSKNIARTATSMYRLIGKFEKDAKGERLVSSKTFVNEMDTLDDVLEGYMGL